jgi:hypothetical protein
MSVQSSDTGFSTFVYLRQNLPFLAVIPSMHHHRHNISRYLSDLGACSRLIVEYHEREKDN